MRLIIINIPTVALELRFVKFTAFPPLELQITFNIPLLYPTIVSLTQFCVHIHIFRQLHSPWHLRDAVLCPRYVVAKDNIYGFVQETQVFAGTSETVTPS